MALPLVLHASEGGVTLPDWCGVGSRSGKGRDSALGLTPPCPRESPCPALLDGWMVHSGGSQSTTRCSQMELDDISPKG